MSEKEQEVVVSRRRLVTVLAIGGVAAPAVLPAKWVKPVFDLIVVPAHAQTSPVPPTTTTLPPATSTVPPPTSTVPPVTSTLPPFSSTTFPPTTPS